MRNASMQWPAERLCYLGIAVVGHFGRFARQKKLFSLLCIRGRGIVNTINKYIDRHRAKDRAKR